MKLIKVVEEESMYKDEFTIGKKPSADIHVEPDYYIDRYLLVKMTEDEYHNFYEWKHRVTQYEPHPVDYKKFMNDTN